MHLAYCDEAGDDGYPAYSSPLFVLSVCYVHYMQWQEALQELVEFRRHLKSTYGLPVKFEVHARPLLLNKNPYRALNLSDEQRIRLLSDVCERVARLPLRFVNVAIIKSRISDAGLGVLDRAVTYALQRIENDLDPLRNPARRFMVITDQGRTGAMRKTARRVQRFNYIPSKYDPTPYRREIKTLIEDPLPKDSRESHFIQICDVVSYVVYLYGLVSKCGGSFSNRMPDRVTMATVEGWLERLAPILNTKAAADDRFGIRFSPKS